MSRIVRFVIPRLETALGQNKPKNVANSGGGANNIIQNNSGGSGSLTDPNATFQHGTILNPNAPGIPSTVNVNSGHTGPQEGSVCGGGSMDAATGMTDSWTGKWISGHCVRDPPDVTVSDHSTTVPDWATKPAPVPCGGVLNGESWTGTMQAGTCVRDPHCFKYGQPITGCDPNTYNNYAEVGSNPANHPNPNQNQGQPNNQNQNQGQNGAGMVCTAVPPYELCARGCNDMVKTQNTACKELNKAYEAAMKTQGCPGTKCKTKVIKKKCASRKHTCGCSTPAPTANAPAMCACK